MISKKLKEVSATLKKKTEDAIDIDGLIDYELKKQEKILTLSKQYIDEDVIEFIYPSVEQIKTSALFKPIDTKYGLTFQSYLEGIETGLYNTWDSAVRTGYLTGQTTQEIVKNVIGSASKVGQISHIGSIQSFRNSVYANTRTALQSFATETQRRVYEENEEYFGDVAPDGQTYKYQYLATLDSRTCLVCGSCGGKLYKKYEDIPQIPQHRGCRCVVLPYFNVGHEKIASKNGYTEEISFNDWLKEQNAETQKDVLGKTRYELFKNGESINQFVDNGRVLTLGQLEESL